MIKRSSGFFKIAFFIFCLFIGLFLISFSLTDIRNYVTAEICIFTFCVSITIIPMILELILYSIGILTKAIKISSKEEKISFKPMKNSKVPYASINDNGKDKMMFFCDKGKIVLLTSETTKIVWESDRDEISIKTKIGTCNSFFNSIYGTKYENVECSVYTTLKNAFATEENKNELQVQAQTQQIVQGISQDTMTNYNQEQSRSIEPVQNAFDSLNIQQGNVTGNNSQTVTLESNEEFDYALTDSDTLLEENIVINIK